MDGQLSRRNTRAPEFHLAKIEAWLAPKLLPTARPKATEAALCHMAMTPDGDTVNDVIDRIKLDKESKASELAEKLLDTARASVESHTRPQRYAIVLFENAEMPIGRREFLLMPPPRNGEFMGETEPSNAQGILGQQMRHFEAMQRISQLTQQNCLGILETELERLRAENQRLRDTHFGMIMAREELLDKSAERNLLIRQKQAAYDRDEKWVDRAEQLISAVAEKALGLPSGSAMQLAGGNAPAPPTGGGSAMARWVNSLPQEKRGKIVERLDEILDEDEARGFLEAMMQEKGE